MFAYHVMYIRIVVVTCIYTTSHTMILTDHGNIECNDAVEAHSCVDTSSEIH